MVAAKVVFLIITVMMPGEQPDINHAMKMKSFDACWAAAKDFTEHDLTEELRSHGAVGMKATCGYQEMPSHDG